MKRMMLGVLATLAFMLPNFAHADSDVLLAAVEGTYQPAAYTKALDTAHYDLDPSTLRTFVVLEKGGVPAERARFFLEWQEYDYRGVTIDLKGDGSISTRRDDPYCYLQRGDVFAVAGTKYFNNTIYLKLISNKVYMPETKRADEHYSRVTVMLGFKFPSSVIKSGDVQAVLAAIGEWLKPFANVDEAEKYALSISPASVAREVDEAPHKEPKLKKAKSSQRPEAGPGLSSAQSVEEGTKAEESDEQRMKNLEAKIDAAKKQMEEAEKEMKDLKKK
jgi:hypothetical protein